MGMSGTYGQADEVQALKALHAALEEEIVFWDTADFYAGGANERLLSQVIKGRRDGLVLATKCGITGINADGLTLNGRPDYIHQACERSLKRLGTDYIDLFYLHRRDPDVPIEESVGAIGELVGKGMVRYAGLSEVSGDTLRRGHSEFPVSALQSEYSLLTRKLENEVLSVLKELEIGLVAYSPLGRGLLTDKELTEADFEGDDFRKQLPRFQGENLKKNLKLAARVREVARARGATAAQVALAWTWHNGGNVVPICGTKRPEYIVQNAQASRLELSPQELEALDFSAKQVAGSRYPKKLASSVES